MRGANLFLLGAAGLTVAGCATSNPVQVRAIADPGAKFRYGGGLLAEGRAQLALGNAGIALETFRKLQREQPESAEAFAGIAACYAAMGRYDIARANYEYALAYAPSDARLLTALASTLERLGEGDKARGVRAEAARLSAPAAVAQARSAAPAPAGVPQIASLTVKLPQPTLAAPKPAVLPEVEIAKAEFTATAVAVSAAGPVVVSKAMLTPGPELSLPREEQAPAPAPTPAPQPKPQVMLAEKPREMEFGRAEVRPFEGPYLIRSSRAEVALITTARPQWIAPSADGARLAEQRPQSAPVLPKPMARQPVLAAATQVRWVPLRYASTPTIQILNAARSQSLAARNRTALLDRGWRKIGIGDARRVRQRSLVLYTPAREMIAKRLAAHFHCSAVRSQAVAGVVVLLGRDSVRAKAMSARA